MRDREGYDWLRDKGIRLGEHPYESLTHSKPLKTLLAFRGNALRYIGIHPAGRHASS